MGNFSACVIQSEGLNLIMDSHSSLIIVVRDSTVEWDVVVISQPRKIEAVISPWLNFGMDVYFVLDSVGS